ncbi:hypothetical protein [Persicobacter sp. CCB-QB2]|uniref:hypothetical protein n=1 Tax=Persicobacter sp. CCB-QB2 TaxID=1561025 RepID=UPI0012F78607|nr:hypothetical protein [Persicobacter sp. CCB-QB2]
MAKSFFGFGAFGFRAEDCWNPTNKFVGEGIFLGVTLLANTGLSLRNAHYTVYCDSPRGD